MIRLVAFLLLLMPSLALAFDYPSLHSVTGVSANDTLNVRAGPSTSDPVIGTLAADAKGVEVVRTSPDGKWGLINLGEGAGWTSLRYLERTLQTGPIPAFHSCYGTEPFWGLEIASGTATYKGQDTAVETHVVTSAGYSANRTDRYSLRSSGAFLASVSAQSCSDGMSDREFGLSIDLFIQTGGTWQHLSGCCSLAP